MGPSKILAPPMSVTRPTPQTRWPPAWCVVPVEEQNSPLWFPTFWRTKEFWSGHKARPLAWCRNRAQAYDASTNLEKTTQPSHNGFQHVHVLSQSRWRASSEGPSFCWQNMATSNAAKRRGQFVFNSALFSEKWNLIIWCAAPKKTLKFTPGRTIQNT